MREAYANVSRTQLPYYVTGILRGFITTPIEGFMTSTYKVFRLLAVVGASTPSGKITHLFESSYISEIQQYRVISP